MRSNSQTDKLDRTVTALSAFTRRHVLHVEELHRWINSTISMLGRVDILHSSIPVTVMAVVHAINTSESRSLRAENHVLHTLSHMQSVMPGAAWYEELFRVHL